MTRLRLLACTAMTLLGAAQPLRAAVVNLAFSDITGSQTFINQNVGYAWDFSFGSNSTYSTVSATFSVKKGHSTIADVVVSVYALGGSASSPLLSATLLASAGSSSAFASELFTLTSSGFTFNAGTNYRLTLTSAAATGSATWYVKNPDNLNVTDGYNPDRISLTAAPSTYDPTVSNASISGSLTPTSAPTAEVPERTATLPLLVLAGVGGAVTPRFRARRS
jgi:hypothetical protein